MKIKKGDSVKILTGNESGKIGEVLKLDPKNGRVFVKGARVVKKHVKASKKSPHGGIVDKTMSINISNVQVVCPNCSKPARIGYQITSNNKTRLCKRCKKPF